MRGVYDTTARRGKRKGGSGEGERDTEAERRKPIFR
jgi:hypothetical protein